MEKTKTIGFLKGQVKEYVALYNKKRQLNKYLSFGIKLLGALLAASITVILGLTFEGKSENLFKNIALIFGALITIVNTWDAFFNHKALWVRFTITMVNLYALKNKISYYESKDIESLSEETIDKLYEELERIIVETNSNWVEMRKEEKEPTKN